MAFDDELQDTLDDCVDQLGSSTTVILRRVTQGVFVPATGHRAPVNADTTVTPIRGPIRQVEAAGPGRKPIFERTFSVRVSEAGPKPSPKDLIIDGASTRRITAVDTECDGLWYRITCRDEAKQA